MELHFFDPEILNLLPDAERSTYEELGKAAFIPKGRPFFINSHGLPDSDLDGFCDYLLHPSRGSRLTWKTYATQVSIYLRFLDSQGKSWKEVTNSDLKNYYFVRTSGEFQLGPSIKGQSWNVAKSALVHLYEYALEAGLITKLPFRYRQSGTLFGRNYVLSPDLSAKSYPEPLNFISIQQYKKIWRVSLVHGRNAQRNLAMTDLLITVGLRISEALSLKLNQLPDPDSTIHDGKNSVPLRVVGKGRKARMVLVPKRILRSILFYIDEERRTAIAVRAKTHPYEESSDSVFLSQKGTPLSARTLQSLFKSISKRVNIHFTPHGCRHTFAVYQLEAMIKRMAINLRELRERGADAYRQILLDPLRQLQLLLGHSSISTTYIYLDFLEESEALVDASLNDWSNWESESA